MADKEFDSTLDHVIWEELLFKDGDPARNGGFRIQGIKRADDMGVLGELKIQLTRFFVSDDGERKPSRLGRVTVHEFVALAQAVKKNLDKEKTR